MGNGPIKRFKRGSIQGTIWKNIRNKPDGTTFTVYTARIVRIYKEQQGEYKETPTFSINEIPKVIAVAMDVYNYLTKDDTNKDTIP